MKKGPMTLPKPAHYTLPGGMLTSGVLQRKEGQKDPVQVYCRIRPLKSLTEIVVLRKDSTNILHITHPNGIKNDLYYNFRNIFSEVSAQKEVYDEIAFPLVKDLLIGKDGKQVASS
jgi:kinesin family protein 23